MARRKIGFTEKTYLAEVGSPQYDPDTGVEMVPLRVHEPLPEEPGPHRGRPRKGTTRTRVMKGRAGKVTKKFMYVDAESMSMLDLSHQEYRVFTFLMGKVEQTGEIRVTGAYIARSIGMTPANVSKTLKSLRERLIIIAEGTGIWRINSWIGYVGDYKKWYPAAMDDEEPYWTREEYEAAQEGPVLAVVE